MSSIDFPSSPDFTTREGYISWRTQWRRAYRKLSRQIRLKKYEIKNDHRHRGSSNTGCLTGELAQLKALATEQLALRVLSRTLAGEQQRAARDALKAA